MAERPISQEEKDKAAAEAVKALAEAERFHAETAKLLHESRKAAAEADTAELALTAANRREAEELAGDKYYHLYRFTETVSSSSVKTCMDRLAFWHRTEPDCPIEVVFFSPGGDVIAGLVLFDYLQELRTGGHHLTTSALGWAASMAGILLQAGDERIMAREAWILIHEVSFGTGGTMGAVEDTVNWLKRIQDRVLTIFAERCKQAGINGTASKPLTKPQLERGWRRKDWWLDGPDCVRLGLVDRIR